MSLGSSRLIQASAGTGKTYALSGQFISLLLAGENPSSILASTFTRKAAGEILERIYLRLAKAVLDQNARIELGKQIGNESATQSHVTKALFTLIENQHQLKVSTLDSFASSIAKVFSEEIGLPAGWSIQDEPSAKTQLSYAVAAVCSSLDSKEIAGLVTALKRGESSRSISNAINNIVGGLLSVFQETNFAAWDWLKVRAPDASLKTLLTNSLISLELPKTKAGEVNKLVYKAHQGLLAQVGKEDWQAVVETTLVQNVAEKKFTFAKSQLSDEMIETLTRLGDFASANCLFRLGDSNRAAYALLYTVINELLLAEDTSGKISFERVTRRIVQLGRSLFSDELYYRLDTKIHHILLDEFQDTSLLQWQLLEPLVDEKLSTLEATSSFFCVGDGKQAIYGWRGGTTAIFDSIPKRWPHIELQTREKSFRSDLAVIELVNSVFGSLKENPDLVEYSLAIDNWLSRFNLHTTALANSGILSDTKDSIKFESVEALSDSDEYADCLFYRLNQIQKENPTSSIGILVRGNQEISHLLDLAQNYSFELSAQGGTSLTRFSVVTSILALLSLINNPGDKVKQYEVSASPWMKNYSLTELLSNIKVSIQTDGLALAIQNFTKEPARSCSRTEAKALSQLLSIAIKVETSNSEIDIPAFIRLVEGSSVEDLSDSKVQVLTIHKSKGLEFDIVVVPDLSWSLKPIDKPDFLIEREGESLRPIRVSLPGTRGLRSFSAELSKMAILKLQEEFEEALSLLYVALTRAKFKMYLFSPASALSSSGISAASVIAYKINPEQFDAETISLNDSLLSNYQEDSNTPEVASTNEIPLVKLKKGSFKLRGLGRISPSTFVDDGLAINKSQDNENFGTLIHKLFSLTRWQEELLDESVLKEELKSSGATPNQSNAAIESFKKYLKLESVSYVLSKSSYADPSSTKVYIEKSFIYREGNALVQGRIDRLLVGVEAGMIVDFKVGKTPENGSQKMQGYIKQLKCYHKGASVLFPKVKFRAVLIFLGDGNSYYLEQ